MAGVNVGKVKDKELGPGGRTTVAEIEIDNRFAPIKAATARDAAPEEPAGRDLRGARRPAAGRADLPDGGTLSPGQRRGDRRAGRDLPAPSTRDAPATSRSGCTRRGSCRATSTPRTSTTRSATRRRSSRTASTCCARSPSRTWRCGGWCATPAASFDAISREDGQLRGLIVDGEATFSALASRDDALADTFQVLPDLPARDARHRRAGWRASPATPTRSSATCASRPSDLAPDAARPRRPVAGPRAACSATSTRWWTPPRRACRPPSACSRAPSRCSSPPTRSCPS